jgi:hypothetical protein
MMVVDAKILRVKKMAVDQFSGTLEDVCKKSFSPILVLLRLFSNFFQAFSKMSI